MVDSPASKQEREQRILQALRKLHGETMTKLAALRKRQLDLYRSVSERLDLIVLKKGSDSLNGNENKK